MESLLILILNHLSVISDILLHFCNCTWLDSFSILVLDPHQWILILELLELFWSKLLTMARALQQSSHLQNRRKYKPIIELHSGHGGVVYRKAIEIEAQNARQLYQLESFKCVLFCVTLAAFVLIIALQFLRLQTST